MMHEAHLTAMNLELNML